MEKTLDKKITIDLKKALVEEEIGIFRDMPSYVTEVDYANLRESLQTLEKYGEDTTRYQNQLKELGVEL